MNHAESPPYAMLRQLVVSFIEPRLPARQVRRREDDRACVAEGVAPRSAPFSPRRESHRHADAGERPPPTPNKRTLLATVTALGAPVVR